VKLTRDGLSLWLLGAGALVAYLLSVGVPPNEWNYQQWLQFAAAAAGWGIGRQQVSSLPSKQEVARGIRDNGEPV
jgi:hypothetical protein